MDISLYAKDAGTLSSRHCTHTSAACRACLSTHLHPHHSSLLSRHSPALVSVALILVGKSTPVIHAGIFRNVLSSQTKCCIIRSSCQRLVVQKKFRLAGQLINKRAQFSTKFPFGFTEVATTCEGSFSATAREPAREVDTRER